MQDISRMVIIADCSLTFFALLGTRSAWIAFRRWSQKLAGGGLRARDTGKNEAYFQERITYTREWLQHLDIYDYQVINEEGHLDTAIEHVKEIIESRLKK
jgi:hypothetical protein